MVIRFGLINFQFAGKLKAVFFSLLPINKCFMKKIPGTNVETSLSEGNISRYHFGRTIEKRGK
jgi:hypothetical protein